MTERVKRPVIFCGYYYIKDKNLDYFKTLYYDIAKIGGRVRTMGIETITSRKNQNIVRLRSLAADAAFRREQGEYLCDGMKLLQEALAQGACLRSVLWKEQAEKLPALAGVKQYVAPAALFDFVSPMKNSPGPVFTVAMPRGTADSPLENAIVLENVQDPGNVGTVLRSAKALGVSAVVLVGACADVYSPKVARATMGAIFGQRVIQAELTALKALAAKNGLPLYAAALSEQAADIRSLPLQRAMVCVGSEGQGLSRALIEACDGQLIIPMAPGSESLNAAVAASLIMWEMQREKLETVKKAL